MSGKVRQGKTPLAILGGRPAVTLPAGDLFTYPAHARKWLMRYSDRLLFGRDPYGGKLQEFLATIEKDLPEDLWRRIYHENALRLVPDNV